MIMVTGSDPYNYFKTKRLPFDFTEKARHLKYLNEFRTTQCPLFLEQQCHYHRPYTCFYWHFPNQKRRRPVKKSDGTFNYNPDVYCDKYDENLGTCPDADDCPYAHRNAGDTERRYHPRYFKTGNCIYETTETGACVKNGLHCAFAHGPDDLRLPVYDIREVQDASSSKVTVNLPASLEKERVLSEDPMWNDMFHVMARYKTESCRKPPRMCRQGYSCPYYHNGKDKRRMPDHFYYRSTPCQAVRPADEWLDSSVCEAGDSCAFCHTRTEQQFHPEIYKSTKCNDVLSSGYCPRGPFCAFAHSDSEMTLGRNFMQASAANLHTTSSPRLHDASPVFSSTSASSSDVFSPGIRHMQYSSRVSPGSLHCPSSATKLRVRHCSDGTATSAESLGLPLGSCFDRYDVTPPPLHSSSTAPYFPILPPSTGFRHNSLSGRPKPLRFTSTDQGVLHLAAPSNSQASTDRKKLPTDTPKPSRMHFDSCGAVLEGYARRLVTTPVAVDHHHQRYPLKQHPLLPFHPHCYAKIPPPPMSPQNSPTTATMTASTPAPSKISVTFHSPAPTNSWWPDSIDCSERHHPDNEYLNSLITDELRTQLTVNTTVTAATSSSDEPFFKLSQHHSNLPQSPLSCLLRQIHLSNQPPPSTATRASALFDEDAVGGITGFSPVSSPQDTQGSLMTQEAAALTDQHPPTGFSSAPMCIPINGHRCSSDVFDVPCGCGRCKVHGCGQDSAFNSTGTPTMGSTSLQSRTSEGQDSALALFEAKDDELQTGLPPDASLGSFVGCGSSYGSMLLPNVPANHFRQQSLISTPVITTTTTTHLSTSLQSPLADLRPDASECLSLRQELEITRRKLYSVLQELDSLRIDYADQTRLASALRVAVHQIVQIVFNHLTDTQRPQEEESQGLPATTTTTMTTKTSSSTSSHLQQIGSNTFLVELLRVLLCDPVVRSTLSPLSMSPSSFSSSSKLNSVDKSSRFLSGARHLLSGSRKCTSNAPGSWATSGGVLEELEEEESLRPSYPVDGDPEGCEEDDDDYVDDEDELRRTLFATRQSQQPLRSAVEGKSISPSPSANSPIC